MLDTNPENNGQQVLMLESKLTKHGETKVRRYKVKRILKVNMQRPEPNFSFEAIQNKKEPIQSIDQAILVSIGELADLKEFRQGEKNLHYRILQLSQKIEVNQRNHEAELEFCVRREMSLLATIQQLIFAKQFQRLEVYLENQLAYAKKRYEMYEGSPDDSLDKPVTRDISMKSSSSEQDNFQHTMSKIKCNLEEIGMDNLKLIPIVKKLMAEKQLSTKKLSRYLSHLPFEVAPKHLCQSFAGEIMISIGRTTGAEVLEKILNYSKNENKKVASTKQIQNTRVKSEMSELVQNYSLNRLHRQSDRLII